MLDPTQNYTYDVMRDIFQEVVETFPDPYVHLGMDEVYYACWCVLVDKNKRVCVSNTT